MSKRSQVSYEIKVAVVRRCLHYESSPNHEAGQLGVSPETVRSWLSKYQADGEEGLKESNEWKAYSEQLKQSAIQEVLAGGSSVRATVKKFHISSGSVLKRWVSKYTEGIQMKPTRKGQAPMNQGRKTTYEERIEMAQYTIAHDLDYQKAIHKYGVSYQQIYTWVRKYKASGAEALQDLRGRKKPPEELNDQSRLKLRIKELEARNEYLEMENALAKKLAKIRRSNTH